jgi:hypothetical protein
MLMPQVSMAKVSNEQCFRRIDDVLISFVEVFAFFTSLSLILDLIMKSLDLVFPFYFRDLSNSWGLKFEYEAKSIYCENKAEITHHSFFLRSQRVWFCILISYSFSLSHSQSNKKHLRLIRSRFNKSFRVEHFVS